MFSCQFFFVPIGLCLVSHLSFKTGELPRKHAALGIITAVVGMITFICEIGTYQIADSTVGVAYGVALLFYGVVLLPFWTVYLGIDLRRLKAIRKVDITATHGLTGVASSDGGFPVSSPASDDLKLPPM